MQASTLLTGLMALAIAGTAGATSSAVPADADRTESPRFEIAGGEQNHEVFPLKSTEVSASVSGVIADVTVTQSYSNTGQSPIEAVYVFPASTRAAVHGVEMRIGERIIRSKVEEKQQARKTYAKAKRENKTTSLLEQERPNVFRMKVANILPGDEVRVTLHYSEKLTANERIYEFVYPTVVGPRYTGKDAGKESWTGNPYLAEGSPSPATFAIRVDLNAGLPLQSLGSPSHDPAIDFHDKDRATVSLAADPGDRDFVLRYRLAGDRVASGLLLHRGEEENFFLLNLEPPVRVKPEQVPARDYLFVIDVSGSMNGFPLDTTKSLMRDLLGSLRPGDTFNVLFFAGGSRVLAEEPLAATTANLDQAIHLIDSSHGGGGTELLPALERALAMPGDPDTSRSIIVVTDGYVSIESEAFELVTRELGSANLFAFGIGSSVNRHLVEGLAHTGRGEPFFVLGPAEAAKTARRFREYVSAPVLTNIEVRHEGFDALAVQPAGVPDVFADRPIELIGKWKGEPRGTIVITGTSGDGRYEARIDVAEAAAKGMDNPSLRPLWARDKVRELNHRIEVSGSDQKELAGAITELGLKYELLTRYTSFVGVDETPREVLAKLRKVQQPLPLPHGVSELAVGEGQTLISTGGGGIAGSAPEPGVISLLLLSLTAALARRKRP